eukprot:PLAT2327.2.p1 GENE.PLAT2327.2~~PLAT2327.2.p1  ORF type:complete len:201 (-),score=86.62 PLAT2327.2:77-679(-)
MGAVPIIIGGSNDQSYPNYCGLRAALEEGRRIDVINVDAHLDVRPLVDGAVHSGSPFRLLLEDAAFTGKLVEFAIQGSQASVEHVEYVRAAGGDVIGYASLAKRGGAGEALSAVLSELSDTVFLSFDIDSIRSADCPGVSCPATIGLTADDALDMCFRAGASGKVAMLDISEFNPEVESYRTARLIAQMVYHFLMGFSMK